MISDLIHEAAAVLVAATIAIPAATVTITAALWALHVRRGGSPC